MKYIIESLTHSSSLRHLVCEVTARVLHLTRSAAALGAMLKMSPDFEVFLHGEPPCLSWKSHLSLALRCSSEGCMGDGVGGHVSDMS